MGVSDQGAVPYGLEPVFQTKNYHHNTSINILTKGKGESAPLCAAVLPTKLSNAHKACTTYHSHHLSNGVGQDTGGGVCLQES